MRPKNKKCSITKPKGRKCFQTKLNQNDALKIEMKTAFICQEMEENGFPLDKEECQRQIDALQERIDWVNDAVLPFIPPHPKMKGAPVTKIFKMNGEYTKQVEDWRNGEDIDGEFCRIEWVPINLNSSTQVNRWLLKNGWKPKEWNFKKDSRGKEIKDSFGNKIKTSPKLTDESLDDLEELGQAGKLIAYRRKCSHKQNQLKGFLKNCRPDGTVPSVVNTLGAATRRMTHQKIANVPTDRKGQFWKNMRKVFWSGSKDWRVVGCDASQIQIRGLAHYAKIICNDDQMIKDLVAADRGEGSDVHTLNGERAGVSRNESKGIFYGYLFGAGVAKTAKQLGLSIKKTEAIRRKFDAAVPFVKRINEHLASFYRANGYITGLDGTRIYAESEHMLLVYLLQNFEAVFMKVALCYATDRIKKAGLRAKFVTMQHDEFQFIAHKDDADKVAKILEKSMVDAGKFVGSRCPVVGEAEIGMTWFSTH